MTSKLFVLLILAAQTISAQPLVKNDWQVMDKKELALLLTGMNDKYQKSNYYFDVTYSLYSDHTKSGLVEKTTGYAKKYLGNYSGLNNDILTIQDANFKLILDSTEKIIMIRNTDTSFFSLFEYKVLELVEFAMSVKKKRKNNELQVSFEMNDYKATSYIINIADGKYVSWFEIYFFYNPFEDPLNPDESKVQNKYLLRVDFSNHNWKYKPGPKDFSMNEILKMKGNDILVSEAFSDYELMDLRFQY